MKEVTAFVSSKIQMRRYRDRVVDLARSLGLKASVMNLDDGRAKIIAEGEDDRLKWFEEAINIKNTLIQVPSIEREHQTLDLQKKMRDLQHDLLDEVRDSRKDLKGFLGERFEKLEGEVAEMRTALKAKGIF